MNILSPMVNASGSRDTTTKLNVSTWRSLRSNEFVNLLVLISFIFMVLRKPFLPNKKQYLGEALIAATIVGIHNWDVIATIALSPSLWNPIAYLTVTLLVQTGVVHVKKTWSRTGSSSNQLKNNNLIRPMLFECRTTHTRLFPIKHSFSYSYLYAGIPIDWKGAATKLLSTDSTSGSQGWFSVHSDDYLMRGSHYKGLETKLRAYLASQGVPSDRYSQAYLITAPRFLGFSFNPVSFWYLYNKEQTLSAMILEVNNTFDERRMYLMNSSSEANEPAPKFTNSWAKDFHVSPFNDREGSYSLSAKNPFDVSRTVVEMDSTIVLRSDEGKPKIIARVYSTKAALDPATMSTLQRFSFLARWWWVGFMTNPRILREARTLWAKRLQVFYRPEVLFTSIGRNDSAEERIIEPWFRAYMQKLVDLSGSVSIHYIPVTGQDQGQTVILKPHEQQAKVVSEDQIEIRILTPAFYTEIVRANSWKEVFQKHGFEATKDQCMLQITNGNVLRDFLEQITIDHTPSSFTIREMMLARLREQGVMGMISQPVSPLWVKTSRPVQPSDLDCFLKHFYTEAEYNVYWRTVFHILLADRISLGFVPLLKIYIVLIKLAFFVLALKVASPSQQVGVVALLAIRCLTSIFINK